ncbi:glycosyltransferase family 22 protein [Paxillus rubicundulus Ve08.2h10]|uniref:Mannosyltransferase n=1 Tax=Paxillus rubicundulus Ve08.2h10 TaxID=930991 RepID=A0A0D0EDD2_9AGAM|nr:glycosyltransferase family 22 protein [Paxillus rubicundulus Ve08.2h10]
MSNDVANTEDLSTSRALALQSLLSSLGRATGDSSLGTKLSPDQLQNLSNKFEEILGDGADQGQMQRISQGQLLNEEGLPVIDISEPILQDSETSITSTIAPEPDYIPMCILPLSERERRRRERDRILDLFEEEERLQQLQEEREAEEERQEAIQKRKASVKAELERLKATKELQKKMGKALVRSTTEAKEDEENVKKEEAASKPQPPSSTPKKSVAFADTPDDEREKKSSKHQIDWGDVSAGRLRSSNRTPISSAADAEKYPMKMHVVERRPTAAPFPPNLHGYADSDDESPAASEYSSPWTEKTAPDEETGSQQVSSSDEESSDEEPLEEEFDWDSAQHHREIALEYYRKRHAIGAETAKAMAAHDCDDNVHDELELVGQSNGRSPLSRFRADRMAGTYDKSHTPASTSIGPSVIPASRQKSLRNSIRVGKLENDLLVGGGSGESGSEDETVREMLRMLEDGSIQNVGPDLDPSSLTSSMRPQSVNAGDPPGKRSLLPASLHTTKPSRFKSAYAGRTPEISPTQGAPSAGISQLNPAVSGVVECKPPRSLPTQRFPLNKPTRPFATEIKPSGTPIAAPSTSNELLPFPMTSNVPGVVTSPSSLLPPMIIVSPSFPRAQPVTPEGDVHVLSRPQHPPVVMSSTVKESSGRSQSSDAPPQAAPAKYMSRFMAERQYIFFRVLVAIFTQSYFQPDEYFQALEPAHKYVFGYGHLTWEWINPEPLRSMLYPAVNIPMYWLLKVSGLEVYPSLVVAGPRAIHGLLAALTDVWVWKLSSIVLGSASGKGVAIHATVALSCFLSLTSFFHSLSLSRSLSNSLETSLTTVALCHFPWDVASALSSLLDLQKLRRCIVFAALTCAVRPTNAIIWVYMFALLFWRLRTNTKLLVRTLLDCAIIGFTAILGIFALDTWFYGRPTLTLLNFLRVNASPVSSFYGSSPWHYYLSQALPILCTTTLPFVLHGLWLAFREDEAKLRILAGCIGWTVFVYSLMGHKEWRFLHPLLPIMHIFATRSIVQLALRDVEVGHSKRASSNFTGQSLFRRRIVISAILSLSIPASVYVVFFHCTGQIKVMSFLRRAPVDNSTTIGFLMPCHSTPWQAYLHRPDLAEPGRMWALGCEPPLGYAEPPSSLTDSTEGDESSLGAHAKYKDQTDVFFESPISYIKNHFPARVDHTFPPSPYPSSVPNATFIQTIQTVKTQSGSWDLGWRHEWPRYIVCFGALLEEPGMRALFNGNGYLEVWKGGWDWEGEGKRRGGVRVWEYTGVAGGGRRSTTTTNSS